MQKYLDIGELKKDPPALYDLAVKISSDLVEHPSWDRDSDCWKMLFAVYHSLWASLPPVVTIDFRDPDEPETWGDFGPPEIL